MFLRNADGYTIISCLDERILGKPSRRVSPTTTRQGAFQTSRKNEHLSTKFIARRFKTWRSELILLSRRFFEEPKKEKNPAILVLKERDDTTA
jgi:hypothetical protein